MKTAYRPYHSFASSRFLTFLMEKEEVRDYERRVELESLPLGDVYLPSSLDDRIYSSFGG